MVSPRALVAKLCGVGPMPRKIFFFFFITFFFYAPITRVQDAHTSHHLSLSLSLSLSPSLSWNGNKTGDRARWRAELLANFHLPEDAPWCIILCRVKTRFVHFCHVFLPVVFLARIPSLIGYAPKIRAPPPLTDRVLRTDRKLPRGKKMR